MSIWFNQEQYPDPTAGEAIVRVLHPEPASPPALNEEGCLRLARAIAVRAVQDYYDLLRLPDPGGADLLELRSLERYFLSPFFRRTTGLNGAALLFLVRKEAQKK